MKWLLVLLVFPLLLAASGSNAVKIKVRTPLRIVGLGHCVKKDAQGNFHCLLLLDPTTGAIYDAVDDTTP